MLSIMVQGIQSPAQVTYWLISGRDLFLLLNLLGLACFLYIAARRILPLTRGERDWRFDRPVVRAGRVLQFWLGQWKHPRYRTAGTMHILFFAGFLILATQAFSLLILGVSPNFVLPGSSGDVGHPAAFLAVLSLPWMLKSVLGSTSLPTLQTLHLSAYFVDVLTFYFLLCYRPFGIQFHVETSLFNVYFAKLDRGTVKPVRWGVSDEHLDQVKSFGVKTFEDFTWKHMLDFYSCADCGRCSDQCPANAVGRPLSPRFITIKARDYSFQHYPMFGSSGNGTPLIGGIYSEDEIWSCTTCGACEEECPLLIQYIDKIVDLRRGMIYDGNVPQSLQKPLKALESRGNPYGKMEKKRAEWTKAKDFSQTCAVKTLDGKSNAD